MQLVSDIVVNKRKEEIWSFLSDPENVAKWDRGVKAVERGIGPCRQGRFEFTTVGHEATAPNHGRMSYRIGRIDPEAGCRVDLISRDGNARYFSSASWLFRVVEQSDTGSNTRSRIECAVNFNLRLRYLWLAPILFFMKRAINRDLIGLKRVLESA